MRSSARSVTSSDPYEALRERFASTPYREIEHPPAASALEYHGIVGSRLEQQAKALLLRRYRADGGKDYLVYALPGNAEADLDALQRATGSSRLRLATRAELSEQTGCRFGELPAVGSVFGCELVLDERLLHEPELYFNAGRLDRSFVIEPARPRRARAAADPLMDGLDGRMFEVVEVSPASEISTETRFEFRERDGVVEAHYSGGVIVTGHIVGRREGDRIRTAYAQLGPDGRLSTGTAEMRIESGAGRRAAPRRGLRLVGRNAGRERPAVAGGGLAWLALPS